jgi:hypothetical protein
MAIVVKKVKFPDGVVRRVKIDDTWTEQEIREKLAPYWEKIRLQQEDLPEYGDLVGTELTQPQQSEQDDVSIWDKAVGVVDALQSGARSAIRGAVAYPIQSAQAVVNNLGDADAAKAEFDQRMASTMEAGISTMPQTALGAEYLTNATDAFAATGLEGLPPVIAPVAGTVARNATQSVAPVRNAVTGTLAVARDLSQVANPTIARARAVGRKVVGDNPNMAGSASAAKTLQDELEMAAALERMDTLRQVGIEGDVGPTVGQLTRNPEAQSQEAALRTMGGGADLQRRFDAQNEALAGELDRNIYNVGKAEDGDYLPSSDLETGNAVKETLKQAEADSRARYKEAYRIADDSEEANIAVNTNPLTGLFNSDWMKKFKVNKETGGNLNALIKSMADPDVGIATKSKDGVITFNDGVTIKQLEDFRSDINSFFDSTNPQQKRLAAKLIEAIDAQLEKTPGGDLYRAARAERRRHAEEYEEHDFVARATGTKGRTSAEAIPPEQITIKVRGLPTQELARFRAQIINNGGEAAWRRVSSGVLEQIKRDAVNNNSRGIDDTGSINTARLAKSIEDLDSAGKLEIMFGPEVAEQLRTVVKAARILTQPIKGTQNPSGTANAQQAAKSVLMRFMDMKVPLASTAVKFVEKSQAEKAARAMLDGEGMLSGAL